MLVFARSAVRRFADIAFGINRRTQTRRYRPETPLRRGFVLCQSRNCRCNFIGLINRRRTDLVGTNKRRRFCQLPVGDMRNRQLALGAVPPFDATIVFRMGECSLVQGQRTGITFTTHHRNVHGVAAQLCGEMVSSGIVKKLATLQIGAISSSCRCIGCKGCGWQHLIASRCCCRYNNRCE